jgi:hypothetical protein
VRQNDAHLTIFLLAAFLVVAVAAMWSLADNQLDPRLSIVTTRPLVSQTELTRDDVETQFVWTARDAKHIGRAALVVGLKLKHEIKTPRPLTWDDLDVTAARKKAEPPAAKKE